MKNVIVGALLALGLTSGVFAAKVGPHHPPISFVVPGGGTSPVSKDQFLVVVIESAHISHNGVPISADGLVEYLNHTMAAENTAYLAVHIRAGATYGDVVHSLDALRKTAAKSIAVSMKELPVGREV